mgnify:CR=1 FL=1
MTSFTPSVPENATVSALTLARGRAAHLRNVILGLTRQTRQPDELMIGVMQDTLYDDLPQTDFPIRQVQIMGRELPLSRARNTVSAGRTSTRRILPRLPRPTKLCSLLRRKIC